MFPVCMVERTRYGGNLNPSRHLENRKNLARIIAIGTGRHVGWRDSEVAEILDHQLRSPLLAVLQPSAPLILELERDGAKIGSEGLATFGDVLTHENPPLVILRLVSDFANSADARKDDPLPANVAAALYFLSIAAARVRLNANICPMQDDAQRAGLKWVENQIWISSPMRELAAAALCEIKSDDFKPGA